ncbi:MAG: hypothetical protein GKC03_08855 [Methanomassiliicoccales archaeon]|nr:hypothetical protein [Methanomassiliicoccales archaeon]NYT15391.1 hypothetical protein [Methanomassiliicoccales archaeon]
MTRIARGGKHIFGWSRVREDGTFAVPQEAIEEYGLSPRERLIVVGGSRSSGGFSIIGSDRLERSPLREGLEKIHGILSGSIDEGSAVAEGDRCYSRTSLRENGTAFLRIETLLSFDIHPGDLLLVIRGSGLGPSFACRGPIVESARGHPEIRIFG